MMLKRQKCPMRRLRQVLFSACPGRMRMSLGAAKREEGSEQGSQEGRGVAVGVGGRGGADVLFGQNRRDGTVVPRRRVVSEDFQLAPPILALMRQTAVSRDWRCSREQKWVREMLCGERGAGTTELTVTDFGIGRATFSVNPAVYVRPYSFHPLCARDDLVSPRSTLAWTERNENIRT